MLYQNLTEISQAALDVTQGAVVPILGVCLTVSILFLIVQLVLSLQDVNLQFLVRFVVLVLVCALMAKGVSDKFIHFTKTLYQSAPALVR